MKIQHVQLSIGLKKVEEAREFFSGVLGIPEIPRPPGLTERAGLWLRLEDGQEIHLAEDEKAQPLMSKAHVALQVPDFDKWKVKLNAKSIAFEERGSDGGSRRLHFRDPFGNRIEILESRAVTLTEENFQIHFPVGDLERILTEIEAQVQRLLDQDQSKLMNWLYRIDVGEKGVRAIFDNVAPLRWAQRIGELVFQRELQKYFQQRKS
jgi:catechol 2,3-dioxygenase-like lactoylglutathione lyase family enzyme